MIREIIEIATEVFSVLLFTVISVGAVLLYVAIDGGFIQ